MDTYQIYSDTQKFTEEPFPLGVLLFDEDYPMWDYVQEDGGEPEIYGCPINAESEETLNLFRLNCLEDNWGPGLYVVKNGTHVMESDGDSITWREMDEFDKEYIGVTAKQWPGGTYLEVIPL